MNDTFWSAATGGALVAIVGPIALALIKRALPSRTETAEARAGEAQADATAAGEWRELYDKLKAEVTELKGETADLRSRVAELESSLSEAEARVKVQASLLRSVCRWALLLRDELLRLDAAVPPMPPDVEAAITSLEA